MPRRKTDATKDDVAAPETSDGADEIRPEPLAGTGAPESESLLPAGAESEPAPRTEPVEIVDAVTVDETEAAPVIADAPPSEPERGDESDPATEPLRFTEEEPHEEEEAGWSFAAKALTGLVLLLAGAALGVWAGPRLAPMLPSGMKPVADWLSPADGAAEIDALRAQLDQEISGVGTRIADLPSGSDVEGRIGAAVSASEEKLAAEIATLRESLGQLDGAGTRQQLDRLDTAIQGQGAELAALKDQLAGSTATSGQLSEETVQRIDVYRGELDGLRAEFGSLQDKVSGLATRIDEVAANADREIATAQSRVGEVQTQAATAETGAAVALLRAAMASGQPFADPLAALADRPGVAVPEGLTAAAASGVPTLAQLRDSFPDAAHAAIRASIMAGAGDGALARSRAFLEAQVASRSLTPQPGMSPDAVLSRMEDKLRHDDLTGVLAESAQLPSEAAAAMAGWLDSARLRLDAEAGLAALDATLPATN